MLYHRFVTISIELFSKTLLIREDGIQDSQEALIDGVGFLKHINFTREHICHV